MITVPAYAMMETEFEGFPKQEEIQPLMQKVLKIYKSQETEDNLNIFGALLVVLKKQHKVSEMEIMKHVTETYVSNLSFKMQATISAVWLSKYKI